MVSFTSAPNAVNVDGDISRFLCKLGLRAWSGLRAQREFLHAPRKIPSTTNASSSHGSSFYGKISARSGTAAPNPNAREVILRPGADCLRLYSVRSTSDAMSRTLYLESVFVRDLLGLLKSRVAFQNAIQQLVRQLSRPSGPVAIPQTAAFSSSSGNQFPFAINPFCQFVDHQLRHVGNYPEPPAMSPYKVQYPNGQFRFVAVLSTPPIELNLLRQSPTNNSGNRAA